MKTLWVYKCKRGRRGEDGIVHGDWDALFSDTTGRPVDWGSTTEIKSKLSQKLIREEMRPGDLVLSWQSDRSEAVGVCTVHDVTRRAHPDGTSEHIVVLVPLRRFDEGVPLHDLKRTDPELAAVAALGGAPATIYATTDKEAGVLLDRCGASDLGRA